MQSELNGTLDFEKPGKTSNAETIHKDAEIINNACGIGMFDDDVNVLMGSNCNGNPSIPGVIPLYSDSNEVVFPTFATSSNDNPNITPSNVTKHHNVKSNIAKSTSSENMSNSNIRVNIPVLNRGNSFNSGPNTYNYTESSKTTLVEIVTQIKRYDPYPCILGIPVMPRIFNTSKTIVFILFVVVGARAISEIIQQMYM